MGIAQAAARSIRNIWGHGEDEYDRAGRPNTSARAHDEGDDEDDEADYASEPPRYEPSRTGSNSNGGSGSGSGGSSGVRRMSGAVPLRVSPNRDKQIYTIKPHGLEEASAAADFLKTGSAVVVNLDDVDRTTAVRIIDFMSGVCYGLDAQGHAMKLGDTIFLFTPGDFEITSDEPDYNENREAFFRDVPTASALEPAPRAPAAAPAPAAPAAPERTVVERVALQNNVITDRPAVERPSVERSTIERPSVASRPWER
jgi:cell division inhibitor SepF